MREPNFKNDVEILEFLEQIREKGIEIWAEDGKLRYRTGGDLLTAEILGILKNSREQILDFLERIAGNAVLLTPIQTAYIVGQKAGCELGNINAHYYIEYKTGKLDIGWLEQAINLVIEKNDALRMIVTHDGKASFLNYVPAYAVSVDTSSNRQTGRQKRMQRSHYIYDYHRWPMFHFGVLETTERECLLYVDFDCIILDAWSAKLMLEEIFELYCGKTVVFPKISFMEYMRLKTDGMNRQAEEYWIEKVKKIREFPKLNFKKDLQKVRNMKFERTEYAFSEKETRQLYEKAKNCRFTPAAVIATIFMKTLAEYYEVPALAVNVTLFNRQPLHEDINRVLGEFTNTAVLSYQRQTGSALDDVRETQKQMWELVRYREFDGTNILKMLSAGNPGKAVMPIVFTCMLDGESSFKEKRKDPFEENFAISQTPQVILDHHVRDDLGYLKVSWDYIAEIFDKRNVTEVFQAYVGNIKKFISDNIV